MKQLFRNSQCKFIFVLLFNLLIVFNGSAQSKEQIQQSYTTFLTTYPDFSLSKLDTLKILSSSLSKKKKVFLTISVNKNSQTKPLPKAFNVSINGKLCRVIDTGNYPDSKAGDGIYTIVGNPKSIEPLSTKEVYKIGNGQLTPVLTSRTQTAKIVWKCRAKISTNCPNCRGPIFGGPCIICVVLDCEVVWEGSIFDGI